MSYYYYYFIICKVKKKYLIMQILSTVFSLIDN
nr:MAG TPA: hypothetical protein [Crassvirales sp.]